jgi:hypothetical protein
VLHAAGKPADADPVGQLGTAEVNQRGVNLLQAQVLI